MKVVLDFETFFSKDYSLRKMPTCLYVRDPRFFIHGVGIKIDDGPTTWWHRSMVRTVLSGLPWDEITLIGHNLYFDGLILVEHFGHRPHRWADTLGMARALLPTGMSRKLADLGPALGLGAKVDDYLGDDVKGVHDLSMHAAAKLAAGCIADCDMTWELYNKLAPRLPEEEHYVLHMNTRMGVDSQILLDQEILKEEARLADEHKKNKIDDSGRHVDDLMSNDKFLAILRDILKDDGLLPWKQNKKGETIPAFAKNDPEWVRFKLDNPDLVPLCEAREEAKSTIKASRARRYLQIAQTQRGTLPMAYKYAGAHTFRFSGDDGLNVQNLPRLDKSNMRLSLMAPEGFVINVADSSQIELRQQLHFSGQLDLLHKLATGDDIYKEVAARFFHTEIAEVTKLQRAVGKALELGGQYGMGDKKCRAYLAGGPLGLDPIFLTEEEAWHAIHGAYRPTHLMTVAMWRMLDNCIPYMLGHEPYDLGPITFVHEGIILPNGMTLDFTGLRALEDGGWAYGVNGAIKFLWGGTLLENIIQALARIIVIDQAVVIDREIAPVVGWTHDECLALSPESRAEEDQKAMIEVMSQSPSWAPDLPLAAEGGFDRRYSK